jgi:hypothetical protein
MPQDPFARWLTPAAPAAPTADPFARWATPVAPQPVASAPVTPEPASGGVGGFLGGIWKNINPLPAIQQFASMTADEWGKARTAASRGDYTGAVLLAMNAHPVTGVGRVAVEAGKAQWDQLVKARTAFDEGRISEGAGYALAGITPLVGPPAAAAGETIGRGEIARGAGEGVGLAGAVALPALVSKARGATVRPLMPNRNPAVAEAVAFGERAGIPIDAATATGNQFVRGAQAVSEHSLPGSIVGARARAAQQQGLATVGEQLAAKGHPVPVVPEQAGAGMREGVLGQVRRHAAEADEAYEALRRIEADPKHARTITPDAPDLSNVAEWGTAGPTTGGFAAPGASTEQVFQGALSKARQQGYAGTADALRAEFMEKLSAGKRWVQERGAIDAENGPRALLTEIRRLGGIKPWEVDVVQGAPTQKLRGEFESLQQAFTKNWGQKGGGTPFRADGLGLDDLADQLSSDPVWAGLIKNDPEALKTVLSDIADKGPGTKFFDRKAGVSDYLEPAGIRPDRKWWSDEAAGAQTIQAPVDLRYAKQTLRPIYDRLMKAYPVAQQEASRGLKALENVVKGPDYASLSEADFNLGAIKSIARADIPELRTLSQGAAAGAVKQLESAVMLAAENLGPEALSALQAGRKATIAKYGAAEVLEALRAESVGAFGQATHAKDAGIGLLRDVAKLAPAELPKIGRAFLDELIGKATAEGGFQHAAAVASRWQNLGGETKRLLFKDPGYVKDLDNFFLLAKKMAESPNPSGSALVGSVGAGVAHVALHPLTGIPLQIGQGAVAKFLHSPAGVRLLTKGFRIPAANKAGATLYAAELSKFASENGIALGLATAGGTQAEQPGAIARR